MADAGSNASDPTIAVTTEPASGAATNAAQSPATGRRVPSSSGGERTGDSTPDGSSHGADPSGSGGAIQLPVVSGDSQSQSEAASQAPLIADDADEEELFGSEAADSDAGQGVLPTQLMSTGLLEEAPVPGDDDLEERELFGSPDIDEKELFGSEDEGPEMDEKELLGSENEMAIVPHDKDLAIKEASKEVAESEPSTMDEREIFGDLSDEEADKVEDVILRRRPAPSDDRVFKLLRLPNILSIEKQAFRRDSIPQHQLEGYKEYINTAGKLVVKLLTPESCVRWRFKKGPDGENLTDEDGRPQYETNTRIVEWEDGSRTMHVGSETYMMSEIDDSVFLFEENSQDIHVCHGFVNKRLVATPRNLSSATHDALKRAQYRKFEANRRSLLMSQEEQMESKQLHELEQEQRRRQEAKRKKNLNQGGQAMDAAFLEDQPIGVGASVADVKRQFRNKPDAKRQKT